jgi:integrase
VRVDPARYAAMRKVVNRLCPPREPGISAKNRRILRQFDDPANIEKLLRLPKLLAATARRSKAPAHAAHLMQMALAVELLLVAPVRVGSLHGLRLSTNIVLGHRNGRQMRPVHLVIPARSVKNGVLIEFELPIETVNLLNRYVRTYLPRLATGPADALFPGATGAPKRTDGLATQIKQTVERYTGLVVNVHAFRHIAARLYLERFPQEYFLVGLLLGHRSVLTTMRNYCELGVRPAARQYSEHVLGRHFATRCPATALYGANRAQALKRTQMGWRWT